jgi:hypothetical protein
MLPMNYVLRTFASLLFISFCSTSRAETDSAICETIAKAEGRQLCYERLAAVTSMSDVILEISILLKEHMFKDAVTQLAKIKPSITTSEITQLENLALKVIRPIPSSKRNTNLEGYRFLNYLNPSNGVYSLKIIHYDDNIRLGSSVKNLNSSLDKFTTFYHPSIPQSVSSGSRIRLNIEVDTSGNAYLRLGSGPINCLDAGLSS